MNLLWPQRLRCRRGTGPLGERRARIAAGERYARLEDPHSAGRFDRYMAYGALGAAVLGVVLLITFFVSRRHSSRNPIPIREYTIVHTTQSRLRNMAWAVATTVVCILVKRALDIAHQGAHQGDSIVQIIRAALEALLSPGTS
jgi:hypothetical protein